MKSLTEVLNALKVNESRYSAEIETGFYATGNPVPENLIEKRKVSLVRVRERIVIAEEWMKIRPRADNSFTTQEREFMVEWNFDPCTPVQ